MRYTWIFTRIKTLILNTDYLVSKEPHAYAIYMSYNTHNKTYNRGMYKIYNTTYELEYATQRVISIQRRQ